MASPFSSLGAFVTAYRIPLLVGAGGLAAVSAYSSSRNRSAAAAAASAPVASIATGATGAEAAALIGQGAGLGLQGAALGLGTADRALGLAEYATMGAQGLAGILAGSQAQVAGVAGAALGTVAGALADVVTSPTGLVVTPQPAAPPPTYTTQPIATAPPPTGSTTTRSVSLGYRVRIVQAGAMWGHTGRCGAWSPRYLSFGSTTWGPATRVPCGSAVAWRISAGGYTGVHYRSDNASGASLWQVQKGTRIQTVNGAGVVVGSRDEWIVISKTGS